MYISFLCFFTTVSSTVNIYRYKLLSGPYYVCLPALLYIDHTSKFVNVIERNICGFVFYFLYLKSMRENVSSNDGVLTTCDLTWSLLNPYLPHH